MMTMTMIVTVMKVDVEGEDEDEETGEARMMTAIESSPAKHNT